MTRWSDIRLAIAVVICFSAPASALGQEVGASVTVRGPVHQNLYVAGGEADIRAEVDGDVVAAGGRVTVGGVVTQDALVAGGDVIITGRVGDDVRVAGGLVTLGGAIGGELLAAGGRVRLAPETAVGGRTWLAGGTVEVRGRVGQALRVAGGTIRLDGQVDGDVDLVGRDIQIGPAARIGGRLTYRSLRAARIELGAKIAGEVTHLQPEFLRQGPGMVRTLSIALRVLGLLAVMTTGVVLLLLFPGFFTTSARTIGTDPLKSLGLGLGILVGTPVLVFVLLVTVLGIPLALTVLAVYGMALLVGWLVAALCLGDLGGRLLGRGRLLSRGGQLVTLLGALIVLTLARWIPVVGGLIPLFALLFGLGALALASYRMYTGRSGRTVGAA